MGLAIANRLTGGWLIGLITLVDTMSSIWFGYCQGVFAGVLVSSDFLELFPQTQNANVSGIVTSCFLLGAFFGALAAFILGDKLGRRRTIILGHCLNVVGALLQFLSWSLPQMFVGRVVNGFGIGLTSTTSPVYLAECARPHLRGLLLVIGASSNVSSFCLANWISYALYYQGGPFQWRFPLAFQLVFAFVIFPVLLCVPESPRWLLLADRDQDAMEVIRRLVGGGSGGGGGSREGDIDAADGVAEAEFRSIKAAIRQERASRVPLSDVLCHRDPTQNFRRLILSCGTQFMQQFAGINALGFYLPTLLHETVGYSLQMSRLLTAVSGTIYLVAAFGSLIVIDRVGRRKLMMFGSVTCATCHLIASMCLRAGEQNPSKTTVMGEVAVAMFIIFHAFFAPTWGGVPWVYAAEVNSLGWRARGAAAATSTNWIMGFVVVQFTKVGIDNLGWSFFLIFAVICYSYLPIVYCFYPETSRRTLEDMDQIFIHNPSWFVFGKQEMTQRSRPEHLVNAERVRIAQVDTPTTATATATPNESSLAVGDMTEKQKEGGLVTSVQAV